ncbi:MAG TPA: efflux RND transporter periplasmic adaptor subunit [Candidatus Polarisedimenticolia bacterium]|nr:efflux RND transporter periplasmic adaptor subunit [Candidatus Polarisedimenticolia bacterium]
MAGMSRKGRRRWIWVGLILILVLGGGAAFYAKGSFARNNRGVSPEDLDIRLGKSEISEIQVTVNEVGTIEPVVKVDVKSTLSGKVTELLVREGDRVVRGQILARVEPDVNQAQTLSEVRSNLNMAEIRARDAQKDLETNTRLHEEGLLSDVQLKDFSVRFEAASETLESARTKNLIVKESGIPIEGKISTSQRVNIVSPMDGTVIKRNVEVGQTVSSGLSSFNEGTALYTVADVGSMLIKASINEVDIGRVRDRMPVMITVDAFPYKRFDGSVTHISPAARLKEKVKVFDVEVTLREQIPDFRAGMTANIEVRGDKVSKVLGVPVEAIFKKKDRELVYVLKKTFDEAKAGQKQPRKTKSGKLDVSDVWERFFEEKEVKVGLVSLERAQILEGLKEGAELALEDPTRPRQIEEEN